MNCFQKLVSLIFWTTGIEYFIIGTPLWIAFKNLYLWYSEQHMLMAPQPYLCCELLSKTCIFDILNNCPNDNLPATHVVNCFQKLVSLIFWTTLDIEVGAHVMLWIAFKNLYLWYSEQQYFPAGVQPGSCELLSKTCIFDILNNHLHSRKQRIRVVNCFQKLVSLIFWTTVIKIWF